MRPQREGLQVMKQMPTRSLSFVPVCICVLYVCMHMGAHAGADSYTC